ncbi:hypothetical protein HPB48_010691 [Haemaphysalis longicornis]|uniref:Uncharacterized protein n=1 Tax=Haemaphysalis longicornis TaxID=44386 RepID=A0A9J6G535_HAELO|nr:hypothetical protein HPB48_010691 [Haemaphysalis longicornis]
MLLLQRQREKQSTKVNSSSPAPNEEKERNCVTTRALFPAGTRQHVLSKARSEVLPLSRKPRRQKSKDRSEHNKQRPLLAMLRNPDAREVNPARSRTTIIAALRGSSLKRHRKGKQEQSSNAEPSSGRSSSALASDFPCLLTSGTRPPRFQNAPIVSKSEQSFSLFVAAFRVLMLFRIGAFGRVSMREPPARASSPSFAVLAAKRVVVRPARVPRRQLAVTGRINLRCARVAEAFVGPASVRCRSLVDDHFGGKQKRSMRGQARDRGAAATRSRSRRYVIERSLGSGSHRARTVCGGPRPFDVKGTRTGTAFAAFPWAIARNAAYGIICLTRC